MSTRSASLGVSPRLKSMNSSVSSHSTPTVTCVPCVPVSVKNDDPNRFVWIVSPSCTNEVNSYAWYPRNVAPMSAVIASQSFDDDRILYPSVGLAGAGLPLFSTAASASTIASDDISSTNVDCDVTGMLRIGWKTCPSAAVHTSCGRGQVTDRPL